MTSQAQVFSPDWGIGASGLHDLASFISRLKAGCWYVSVEFWDS